MKKFLLVVLIIIGILFGFFYYQYNKFTNYILGYTQEAPKEITKTTITDDEMLAKRRNLEDVKKEFENGTYKGEYVLVGEEANVLIKNINEEMRLSDWVYMKVDDSKLKGEFSIPLSKIAFFNTKKFAGRFLNGVFDVEFNYTKANPRYMQLKINNLMAADRDISFVKTNQFNDLDLKSLFDSDENIKKMYSNIDTITLDDDRLIIKALKDENSDSVENANPEQDNPNEEINK